MRVAFALFGLILSLASAGQTFRSLTELGTRAESDGDWNLALHYYQQAFALDSANFDATIRYATALRETKDYRRAAYYYHKTYSKDKGKKYPEGLFYLALMHQQNGNYLQALKHFEKYLKKNKRNKASLQYRRAEQGVAGCTFALNARRDAGWLDVLPLGTPLNTPDSEFAPWLLKDSTLFVTAQYPNVEASAGVIRHYNAKLNADSSWTAADDEWTPFPGERVPEGNGVISPILEDMYLVRCESECTIYRCTKTESGWGKPERLSGINQSGYNSTMPHVGRIGKKEVLFYASNRPGGQGGYDIWWSELNNGIPSPPVNAGSRVNSPENEVTPFYLDSTLYFSSTWHAGFGGYDVFSSKGKPRSLDRPINMGYPLNSPANDLYFRYFLDSDLGLMASNREGSLAGTNGTCCNDLYRLDFTDSTRVEHIDPVYANLEELSRYLPVTLYFHNDEPNPNSRDTVSSVDYLKAYDSYLKLEAEYDRQMQRGKKAEAAESAAFEVTSFFDFEVEKGKNDLELFMPLLLQALEEGTSVELQVRGFASPRAKSDYNVNLTKRRISSLERTLLRYDNGVLAPYFKGAAPNGALLQLTPLPYGEYQADQTVSDALDDEQESIYSRGARLERKIMVESVQRISDANPAPEFTPDRRVHDFGNVDPRFPVSRAFKIRNTGNAPMSIIKAKASCGCTVPELAKQELQPGEETELLVTFNPEGLSGALVRAIEIWVEGQPEPQVIQITANVAP